MELIFSELPRLRPRLQAYQNGAEILLTDPLRIGSPLGLTRQALSLITLFNGTRNLFEIQAEFARRTGEFIPTEWIQDLVSTLDEEYLLDSPRLKELLQAPVRKPACIGVYSEDPQIATKQIDSLFTAEGGPGLPKAVGCRLESEGPVNGVLVPHMDYLRGNITYGWGFKEFIERTDASLFIVIGTSHYSSALFSVTRQNFLTPFGEIPTDRAFVDSLENHYGLGLTEDPMAHAPEHSIELELVILHRFFSSVRPFRIVPILVGSFWKTIESAQHPREFPTISCFVDSLRKVIQQQNEPIGLIISGDLAHIGPKFGANQPVTHAELQHSYTQDQLLLQALQQGNSNEYFSIIQNEKDERNICGYPPTMIALELLHPTKGRTLHYQQYVAPDRNESVSFSSVIFERA